MRSVAILKNRQVVSVFNLPPFKWSNVFERVVFIDLKLKTDTSVAVSIMGKHQDHVASFH
jgi:hypothetical protein